MRRNNKAGKASDALPKGRHMAAPAEAGAGAQKPEGTDEQAGRPSPDEQKRRDAETIKYFIMRAGVVLMVFVVLFVFIFKIVAVPDMSMKPKLMAGDLVLAYRMDRRFVSGTPVVYDKDGKERVGRIIAVPGDTIEISKGILKVNGAVVAENDIYYKTDEFGDAIDYPLALGPGQYFIMGDMREGSRDSRYFGPVDEKDIVGKISVVVRRSEI